MKKIFNFIKKVFIEPPLERYTNCLTCGKELVGSQRKFCSDKCINDYYNKKHSKKKKEKPNKKDKFIEENKEIKCSKCNKLIGYVNKKSKIINCLCSSCKNKKYRVIRR